MRKRMRPTQNMGNHHDFNPNDFLSRLPDENLVSILSGLPLKEAVATSGLSRRWRYVWCQALRLDLEDDIRLDMMAERPRLRLLMRNKYINWVNRVIRQHRGVTIEEFKISFDLDKDSKGAISKWIEFALSKNVQKLELDLMDTHNMCRDPTLHFVAPSKLLGRIPWSSLKQETDLNFVFPKRILDRISKSSPNQEPNSSSLPHTPSTKVMEIKFLKVLILKSVNINDETMSEILVTCKALEHLNIQLCGLLMNIKSSGLDALSYVEISCCPDLESIQICGSPNLASFYYLGRKVDLKVYKDPKRTRFSVLFVNPVRS